MTDLSLTEQECWGLLGSEQVGRVAFTMNALPAVLPVRYQVLDWFVVFFTDVDRDLVRAMTNAVVAFEVDRIEDGFDPVWSVNAVGQSFEVKDRLVLDDIRAEWEHAGADDGSRLLALRPEFISGRRFGRLTGR